MTNSLEKLSKINGVSFIEKETPGSTRTLGLISQDVQNVYPELVKELSDGTLALNYQGIIGPLVEAIKELDVKIDNLLADNINKDRKISELHIMIHGLGSRLDVIEGNRRPPLKPYNP